MHPAFSVIFLTTLIGAGQGLFLALFTGQSYAAVELLPPQDAASFYATGSALSLAFLVAGLGASFFHLGHPERAWRAVSQWRTSWLSREVIALPVTMALIFAYGVVHMMGWDGVVLETERGARIDFSLVLGAAAAISTFALFICTAMIYAGIRFLQEWATPLTVINYLLLGSASGFTLAAAFAGFQAPSLVSFYGGWAILLTLSSFITRGAALVRNSRLRRKSTMQSAIGVRHNRIQQKAMGMMGGAFNTREFSHGKSPAFFNAVKWVFLLLTFPLPALLLWAGIDEKGPGLLVSAFLIQYLGLLFERWYFFAQANHPQSLYYQTA